MALELGKYGVWLSPQHDDEARTRYVVEAERLGYGTAWIGLGLASDPELELFERLLEATSTITVASAIVNMWTNDAAAIARSYRRLADRYGDRFLLGVGIGHPEAVQVYQKPYDKMVEYLDRLDEGGVPKERRVLAALGPRALELARDRAAGSHPYLTVPEHTRRAREILGSGALLAPEHKVVLETDPEKARALGRPFVEKPYLGLRNYVSNLLRLGFTEQDVAGSGSDELIDALTLHGTPEVIAQGLRAHFAVGADHVGVHVLTPQGESPMPGFRALAAELLAVRLNPVLAGYFEAKNAKDVDGMLAHFADDAVVHDEGKDHRGLAAIKDWIGHTTSSYGVTAKVTGLAEAADETVVTAELSGTFDGSPISLRYRFALAGDRIVRLSIAP